jgi:hypothetical protein
VWPASLRSVGPVVYINVHTASIDQSFVNTINLARRISVFPDNFVILIVINCFFAIGVMVAVASLDDQTARGFVNIVI